MNYKTKILSVLFLILLATPVMAFDTHPGAKPEIKVQLGHPGGICAMALSADGRYAVSSGSEDKVIKLWDVATGKEIRSFTDQSVAASSLVFLPNGKHIVSAHNDRANYLIKIWDITTGKVEKTLLGHTDFISKLAVSGDGQYLISCSTDKTIRVWNVNTGNEYKTIVGGSKDVRSVAISPDGKYIVSAGHDFVLCTVDPQSGKKVFRLNVANPFGQGGKEYRIDTFTYQPEKAVREHSYYVLKLWDIATGKEIRNFAGHSSCAESVEFSKSGKYIISGSDLDGDIKIWDTSTGKEISTFRKKVTSPLNPSSGVFFSPDDRYFLFGNTADSTLTIRDVNTGNALQTWTFRGSSQYFQALFMPDGKSVLTAFSGALYLFDISTGETLQKMRGYVTSVNNADFSPDGKFAAAGYEDGTVKLWNLQSGKPITTFKGQKIRWAITRFTHDGKYIISAGQRDPGTVVIWKAATGEKMLSFDGYAGWLESMEISPDDRYLALSGSHDPFQDWEKKKDGNSTKIYDIATGKLTRTITGHTNGVQSASFSPDGKLLVSASEDKTMILWNLATGQKVKTFAGHTDRVNAVAFSPNGEYLVSTSSDKTTKTWNVSTGKVLRTYELSNEGGFVRFSADGKYLLGKTGTWTAGMGNQGENLGYSINAQTGKRITVFQTDSHALVFSPDGKRALSCGNDGTVKVWNAQNGKLIYTAVTDYEGRDYLAWTPDFYFTGTNRAMKDMTHVVSGMNVFSIDQFFDHYFRPDILTARLRGIDTSGLAAGGLLDGFKLPPEIAIEIKTKEGSYRGVTVVKKNDYFMENDHIYVRITAKSKGGGIKGLRLFNNGKMTGEYLKTAEEKLSHEFVVALANGTNALSAIGFSLDMTESAPVTTDVVYKSSTHEKPKMYILAIGINQYKNSKYNLSYSVEDVEGFIEVLTPKANKIFSAVESVKLVDQEAKRDNIFRAIDAMKEKINPEDVFILFYAGHGVALDVRGEYGQSKSEFFYILHDVVQMTDHSRSSAYGISGTEMKARLAGIKAEKQIIFVDACNSGAFAGQYANRGAAEENALAKLSRATGCVIFASTTKEQYATEFSQLKHGIFTYVVIEALKGNASLPNGQLTAASIKAYVDDKIPEYTAKYKGEAQYPTTFLWGNDFPVGMR